MIAELIILAGALLYVVAAIGVLRLPDLFQRMHAATKAGSAAMSLVLIGFMISQMGFAIAVRASAAIVFLFLTLPLASFVLARVAIATDSPMSPDTRVTDEMEDPSLTE